MSSIGAKYSLHGNRIVVVGISGTGKSRLARRLASASRLPLHHMDTLIWRPNWVEADRPSIATAVTRIAAEPQWIVEGWVDDYSSDLLDVADHIIDLDFPGWLAALGGVERWWRHRGAARPELPPGCTEKWNWDYLVTMLLRRERRHLDQVLAGRRVTRLRSRRAANRVAVVPR
jgi:adenylate kinase family enzyme